MLNFTVFFFHLGGPEIDESVITKQKYHVGRCIPPKWIIGIYDVTTKKGYAAYIPNRSSETLLQHIQKVVLAGTEIWTDGLRSYRCLAVLGGASPYTHKTVNHSRYFRDPLTGVCTNHVEAYWSRLKGMIRRLGVMGSPFLPEYTCFCGGSCMVLRPLTASETCYLTFQKNILFEQIFYHNKNKFYFEKITILKFH